MSTHCTCVNLCNHNYQHYIFLLLYISCVIDYTMDSEHVFIGTIIHSKSLNELEVIKNGFIVVNDGKVTYITLIL